MIGIEKRPTVAGDEADREGLAAMQALREVVRAEAQRLRHRDDPRARLLFQAAAVVERLRNGADADIGGAGDIADRQGRASRPLWRRHGRSRLRRSFDQPVGHHFTTPLKNPDT
jgi:hypothetical protein